MGVYWSVKSYKKDDSYITGEVKSRELYEFNLKKASDFLIQKVSSRHGVQLFHEIIDSSNIYENFGLFDKNEMLFFLLSEDLIDGTTLREDDNDDSFGLLCKPNKALLTLEKISNKTIDFDSHQDKEFINELIEMLKTAVQNDYLIFCFWE